MRKILTLIAVTGLLAVLTTACWVNSGGVEDEYKDWREKNLEWFNSEALRNDLYKLVIPSWDPNARVLIHWYNDTTLTRDNLKPLYTSTVDAIYRGALSGGTPIDSSYLVTSPADSIYRTALNGNIIEGWAVGITQMHVGDSCRIIIPYTLGYGSSSMGSVIKPYSTLVFDIKLADIYAYETN